MNVVVSNGAVMTNIRYNQLQLNGKTLSPDGDYAWPGCRLPSRYEAGMGAGAIGVRREATPGASCGGCKEEADGA